MALYGLPGGITPDALNQLMGQSRGAWSSANPGQQQDISEWTQLASMLGYNPDPFPKQGSAGQDEIRFMNTMKSIMDQQLGAFGPGSQINQLPGSLQQMFQMFSPLLTSPGAVRTLSPAGTAGMFKNGYQQGPLPTAMSPLIQMLASAMNKSPLPGSSDSVPVAGATNPALTAGASSVGSSNINQTPNPPGSTPAPVFGQDIASQAAAAGRAGLDQAPNGISPTNSFTGNVPGGGPSGSIPLPSGGAVLGPNSFGGTGLPPGSPGQQQSTQSLPGSNQVANPASIEGIGQELSTVFNLLMQPGALQKIMGMFNPMLMSQNAANSIPNNLGVRRP